MHTCHLHMCSCHATMHTLESENAISSSQELGLEQKKDVNLESICVYLEKEKLTTDAKKAEMTVRQSRDFVLIDGVLHFVEKGGGLHTCNKTSCTSIMVEYIQDTLPVASCMEL